MTVSNRGTLPRCFRPRLKISLISWLSNSLSRTWTSSDTDTCHQTQGKSSMVASPYQYLCHLCHLMSSMCLESQRLEASDMAIQSNPKNLPVRQFSPQWPGRFPGCSPQQLEERGLQHNRVTKTRTVMNWNQWLPKNDTKHEFSVLSCHILCIPTVWHFSRESLAYDGYYHASESLFFHRPKLHSRANQCLKILAGSLRAQNKNANHTRQRTHKWLEMPYQVADKMLVFHHSTAQMISSNIPIVHWLKPHCLVKYPIISQNSWFYIPWNIPIISQSHAYTMCIYIYPIKSPSVLQYEFNG